MRLFFAVFMLFSLFISSAYAGEMTFSEKGKIKKDEWRYFGPFKVGSGKFKAILKGSNNADLYVKRDSHPTKNDFDSVSHRRRSNERIILKSAGTYYVGVLGVAKKSRFKLKVKYSKKFENEKMSLLFVQDATGAYFEEHECPENADSEKCGVLTLTGVADRTLWFADRPSRLTGFQTTQSFVDAWAQGWNSFADNPPNADLAWSTNNSSRNAVIEMLYPIYDAANQTLSYAVEILGGGIPEGEIPHEGIVALFIDSIYEHDLELPDLELPDYELPDEEDDPSATDPISFKDSSLEGCVRDYFGRQDGVITVGEVSAITNLDCSGKNIEDISGLEHFTGLTSLKLYNNKIEDITPLGYLINLETLEIYSNNIKWYWAVQNLKNLKTLDISQNQLQLYSLKPIENLTNLVNLAIDSNQIYDISPLKNFTNLATLFIGDNCITDFSPISDLNLTSYSGTTLEEQNKDCIQNQTLKLDQNLDLCVRGYIGNPPGDIFPKDVVNITYLDCSNKGISNVSGLEYFTNLQQLHLQDNQIIDLSPLSKLSKNLQNIVLNGNSIDNISPLSHLTNLLHLELSGNSIVDISPLSNLTNLINLYLDGNCIVNFKPIKNINFQRLLGDSIADQNQSCIDPIYTCEGWDCCGGPAYTYNVDGLGNFASMGLGCYVADTTWWWCEQHECLDGYTNMGAFREEDDGMACLDPSMSSMDPQAKYITGIKGYNDCSGFGRTVCCKEIVKVEDNPKCATLIEGKVAGYSKCRYVW